MSLFFDVLAWVFIGIGTVNSALTLVAQSSGSTKRTRARHGVRRRASPELRRSLLVITAGACLLAIQSRNYTAQWLAAVALTMVVVWDIGPWLKSRARRKSGKPTAESS